MNSLFVLIHKSKLWLQSSKGTVCYEGLVLEMATLGVVRRRGTTLIQTAGGHIRWHVLQVRIAHPLNENLFQKHQLWIIAVTHPWPSDDVQAQRMRCGAPPMSFHPRHASTSAI